jgi:ABC-type branched-subunit amino acid transport system ATPase component
VVDIACVLAHEPSVLLLDEPSSGIAQREAEALGPLLTRIRDETGASLLVIEHDVPLLLSIADLSTGTRRIVELACALAMDPAVLLLDEPSAGVAQRDTEALGPLLRRVQHETGAAIVIIEHDMSLLTGLCDELVALENGHVIFQGAPAEVLAHPQVIESYLGVNESAIRRSGTTKPKRRSRAKVKVGA